MSNTLKAPSPLQLRAELPAMVRQDLLGPAAGPYEEAGKPNIRGRYIVGLLAPRVQSLLSGEQDNLADGRSLLISSANLTEYAMTLNMGMGLLIHGGALPAQVEAHLACLGEQGVFEVV
jgi:hypothetical protein